jgi:olefin beta-lactone synthetase
LAGRRSADCELQVNNIAQALSDRAAEAPERVALQLPQRFSDGVVHYRAMPFAELEARSNALALGLQQFGIGEGVRTVLMVRPSAEFFLLMFALFKARAVPVLVDPGIDKAALKQCLDDVKPEAFIGIAIAQLARLALGWGKATIRKSISVAPSWLCALLPGTSMQRIEASAHMHPAALETLRADVRATKPDQLAAILFTSGSTGVPKGVEYTHRMFTAQVALLREAFAIAPGTINMPTFPPFALFDPALGCTSVIPMMDATRPARADPRKLISAITQFNVSQMFGSPALLRTLVADLERRNARIENLRCVMSAGAPVPPALVEKAKRVMPKARIFTPYGATEALPVAVVDDQTLLGPARALSESGAGICVGRVLPANIVRILPISDAAIAQMDAVTPLAAGEIGEIVVHGPSVTHAYAFAAEKTSLAKIYEGTARVWHRMGDVGYLDTQGQLWYCGRKSHRVELADTTLFSECIEALFNAYPHILQSALVAIQLHGARHAAMVLRMRADAEWTAMQAALRAWADQDPRSARITQFFCYPHAFPVDIRHNAKINRERLRQWAQTQCVSPNPR